MPREGDKWRVVKGDCLWNIANSVYGNPYKWPEIADANGINRSIGLIYPGQLFVLPGITAGTNGGGAAVPPPAPVSNKPKIEWFALQAGSETEMLAIWSYNANNFHIRWEQWDNNGHLLMLEDNTNVSFTDQAKQSIGSGKNEPGYGTVIRFSVRPCDKDGKHLPNTDWAYKEYDFKNNPPLPPSTPNVELKDGKLKCTLTNIDEKINGDTIEFVIYRNNTEKYKTGQAKINMETRTVSFSCNLEPGASYIVRCRAVRNGNIYGNWSDYTSECITEPTKPDEITELRPQVISEQGSKQYAVYVEWTPVETAKNYEIQYTTDISYFDISTGNVHTVTTEEKQGNKCLITDIDLGHEYFFRVRALNDSGNSDWTDIKSTTLGTRPDAPTTWSNVTNCIVGEDLNLYWTHNSTDGSLESLARVNIVATDLAHPELAPMEFTKIIRNEKPEEDRNKTSVYKINTNDPEWTFLKQGFVIKWKVQTAGVVEEYSEWSTEREVNVYMKPELEIDIKNQNGQSVNEISTFPFYINVLAKPANQIPISYYIEVIANQGYETIDAVGKEYKVNPGDKVYQKYYDPSELNAWSFMAEMTPGNIDLKNGINYTVNCTVAMNSSLSATESANFHVYWTDNFYEVDADIILNKDTLEASIHPFCNEFYIDDSTGETLPKLTENCTLSVYRKEYDGTFTLIASGINNSENTFVVDPHPSLDYARYRVTATSKNTGGINYADIKPVKFGEPSVVIQWAEAWSKFETTDEEDEEPLWSGSMIKIPYNVDVSESAGIESTLVNYIGRKHPVSYYGTHVGETATWNVDIPREDTNMIYALRRLAKWAGDVYVREPSGIGYWATITVSFNLKHRTVIVPVTFNIKRVEGGI